MASRSNSGQGHQIKLASKPAKPHDGRFGSIMSMGHPTIAARAKVRAYNRSLPRSRMHFTSRTDYQSSMLYRLLWPTLLVTTIVAASGSEIANMGTPLSIDGLDKIAHLLLFGLLATHLCRYPDRPEARLSWGQGIFAICVVFFFGLSDELHQAQNPYRTFELADLAADFIGATVAVVLYQRVAWYRRLLEWQPFKRRISKH